MGSEDKTTNHNFKKIVYEIEWFRQPPNILGGFWKKEEMVLLLEIETGNLPNPDEI